MEEKGQLFKDLLKLKLCSQIGHNVKLVFYKWNQILLNSPRLQYFAPYGKQFLKE